MRKKYLNSNDQIFFTNEQLLIEKLVKLNENKNIFLHGSKGKS
jgi:hypothetical protein